jgi:hypothetical protein
MKYLLVLFFGMLPWAYAVEIPDGYDIVSCDNGALKVSATNRGFIFILNNGQARQQLELSPDYGRSFFEVQKIEKISNLEFKGQKYGSYPMGRIFYVKRDRQDLMVESFRATEVTGGGPLEQREKISEWKWFKCKFAVLME